MKRRPCGFMPRGSGRGVARCASLASASGESPLPPPLRLSPSNPLRWASMGAPQGRQAREQRPSSHWLGGLLGHIFLNTSPCRAPAREPGRGASMGPPGRQAREQRPPSHLARGARACRPPHRAGPMGAPEFEMLGRSKFALRRGFASGKTLVTPHLRRIPGGRLALFCPSG